MSIEEWTLTKTERYMYDRGQRDARIAAFGAIRRAAKHARDCDLECPQSNGFVWRGDTPKSAAIRCAIRLAIGSDKA